MILTDEHTALMDQESFDDLLEYSCTIPTQTTIGKRWKHGQCSCTDLHSTHPKYRRYGTCKEHNTWFMREYEESDNTERVKIHAREIIIIIVS